MSFLKKYKPKMLSKIKKETLYGVGIPPSNMYGPFDTIEKALEVVPRYQNIVVYDMGTRDVIYAWDMNNSEWVLEKKWEGK